MFTKLRKSNNLKKVFFKILDFLIISSKLNSLNNDISTRNKVIWLAETGSRDFIPRIAQAISLWEEYKIPSLVIHKHMLKKFNKKILKNSIVIDKSATSNCIRRLRYSKLNGALNLVIPEELLLCDKSQSLIEGSLHPKTLNYVDTVLSSSEEVRKYIEKQGKEIKLLELINPRLSTLIIQKNCKAILNKKNSIEKYTQDDFILINDKLSLKFSSYKDEIDLLENDIFRSTSINPKEYVKNFLREEDIKENLLINLIKKIREEKLFNHLKIVLRPHPSVDMKKYKKYFKEKLKDSYNYLIIREGTAIEWMQRAKIIFHNNCTTGVEGHYAGLRNIFNYANTLSEGTTEEFKSCLKPLGVKKSIYLAKDLISLNKENYLIGKSNLRINRNNLYIFLGEKMHKDKSKELLDDKLFEKLGNLYLTDFSVKDRWKDAENRIEFINNNNDFFDKKYIKAIGKVGVKIGSFHQ